MTFDNKIVLDLQMIILLQETNIIQIEKKKNSTDLGLLS